MPSNYDQPFQEALDYFTTKGYELNPGGWAAIAQEANAGAFTVAKVAQMDILEDIKGALEQALNDGLTYQEFADNLIPTLEQKGWLGAASRLGVIFETNLAAAYNVGRWTQIQQLADERPFLQYRGIRDSRTRKLHLANFGKTYRIGDPFWAMWYPPNGFRCRCYVVAVDQGYLDANKLSVSSGIPVDDAGKQILPDIGFRYNVGEAGMNAWKPIVKMPELVNVTPLPIETTKHQLEPRGHNFGIMSYEQKLDQIISDYAANGQIIDKKMAAKIEDIIDDWSGEDYSKIRKTFFGSTNKSAAKKAIEIETFIENSAPMKLGENEILMRGFPSQKAGFFENLKAGDIYDLNAPSSWTTSSEIATKFAKMDGDGVILKIIGDVPPQATSIAHLSRHTFESEVLVSGRTRLQIVGSRKLENGLLEVEAKYLESESLESILGRIGKKI